MIDYLIEETAKKKAPVVVGLDPQLSFVPDHLLKKAYQEQGETLEAAASAVRQFNFGIIDAVADLVPAVKPQVAFYELLGIPGLICYRETVAYAKKKGLVVIGDVKRGDIGSTSGAYAVAHLGKTPVGEQKIQAFGEDFVTVNPYLGTDGVRPFVEVCKEENKGIFVLVKTSNPSSGEFQDRSVEGRPLYERVAEKVEEWGSGAPGKGQYNRVGAVIGATWPEAGKALRELLPHTFLLIPGYGAQGGTAKDLVSYFHPGGQGAIVNSSRGIIAAWKSEAYQKYGSEGYGDAARAATRAMIADLSEALA